MATTKTYTLVNGQPADATQVNKNFDDLLAGINAGVSLAGSTMTGELVAQSNTDYTGRQVHNVVLSASDASGGSNGDIWIKYTA